MFIPSEERDYRPCWENDVSRLDDAGEVLLKAAEIIEERGWCQNALSNGTGFCAVGALGMASRERGGQGFTEAWARLEANVLGLNVADWNDNPFRTKEEVVAKLRAVALGGK